MDRGCSIVPEANVDPTALDPAGLGRKKLCGSWFRNRAYITGVPTLDKLEKKELGEIGQLAKVTCNEGVFRETNLRSNFVRLLIYRRG